MLDKDIKESYDKIKPSDDLKKRILDNLNNCEMKTTEKEKNVIYKNKPLLACASIVMIMFISYCCVSLFDDRLIIYDIDGNNITKKESTIPAFDVNKILNNTNNEDISVMTMRMNTEYTSVILQINAKEKTSISVDVGNMYIIDEEHNFTNVDNIFEIKKNTPICWAFENIGNNFQTQMYLKSKNTENVINLKYENGTFSAYLLE